MPATFAIALNREDDSRLPYLLRLPLDGGLILEARDTWARSTRVYCHPFEEGWPDDVELVEETAIRSIHRRAAVPLPDRTPAFQMQRLADVPSSAVVVEGRYPRLLALEHVSGACLADMLARLQVRYAEVPVVLADSRRFAEEWTYRFLAAALAEAPDREDDEA